ncbi:cilia- and flagella-associated protein 70 isoform X2 [Sardina pilchardus]|uniref:cilia- and flagella-associated protein 70 isoform X2 n=1 Tax=Sardina pilchardus TaxID=27697 RepID=UPI002E0E64CC
MDTGQVVGEQAVSVQITVLRGHNLKGSRTESFLSFVRTELNGVVLGDSPKVDAVVDEAVDYNFTCSFECSDAAHNLDDLAHKPVILTVTEILPKEKKQKEEKTIVLGQAVVDLLPLLHGQSCFTASTVLYPAPGSPGETAALDGSNKPVLDVSVSVPKPLLPATKLSESNLLKVTVETAYSVPDVWNQAAAPASGYAAALQVPLTAEKEQILMFSNGMLKMGGEREPVPRPKKWPQGAMLASGAQYIPGVNIEEQSVDMEDGDMTTVEDKELRVEAEINRKRVSWDTERRCFLDAGGAAWLTRRIVDCRLWPIEIMKVAQMGAAKGAKAGKDKGEDETQISFHGVAYVDLAPLLYPGATCVRGAYKLHPFYESELMLKTKRNHSVLRESMRPPVTQGKARVSSVGSCKAAPSKIFDKGGKDTKESPRKLSASQAGTQGKVAPDENVIDVEPQINTEGQMYADSKSYIVIEIALDKPLVPKRPPVELAKRVMELIPPRPLLPRRPAGAERAVQEFQAQVASVAAQVLDQYQQLFGAAFEPSAQLPDPNTQEQRKAHLFGELNYSGKYFAFKEQLKYSVVRIVREKMLRTEAFTDVEQLQAFLSQLYVFLVDEMHKALNKTLAVDDLENQPQPMLECSQLKHFAKEAQLNQDFQLATKYYQERLARDRNDPSHWFDYGCFYMLRGDYQKAEECFHQAVSINQAHLSSLLMCGILAEMDGRYEDAETFFEGATCVNPSSVVAWTLFGVFYQAQDNSIQAEMAFLEACKQQRAGLVPSPADDGDTQIELDAQEEQEEEAEEDSAEDSIEGEDVESSISRQSGAGVKEVEGPTLAVEPKPTRTASLNSPSKPCSIYMETVEFLLQSNALQTAQRVLAQELLCPEAGLSSSYHLALAQLHTLRGEYGSAETNLSAALRDSYENPDVWALWGHLHFLRGESRDAQKCYERTLDFVADASDTHPIYLRLGSIYLKEGQFEKAKATYLRACKSSPSCLTWLGLGIACYRLEEMTEAEDALTEANTLNNTNAEVWGYLALVCLQMGRKLEAEQSYKYTMKLDLQNEPLLQEINEMQKHVGFGNPCF